MWLCIISGKQLEDTYWLRAALLSSRADLSGISKWGHCGRERANILPDFWLACKCNQCEFASSQASNLRTHVKRHTGDKWPLAERKREGENILPGFRSRSMLAGLLEEAATGQNWFANEFSHSLNSNPPTARSSFSQRKTPISSHLNLTTFSFELLEKALSFPLCRYYNRQSLSPSLSLR